MVLARRNKLNKEKRKNGKENEKSVIDVSINHGRNWLIKQKLHQMINTSSRVDLYIVGRVGTAERERERERERD